jgi:hypothetical protein
MENKEAVDPRLKSFLYNFNTLINYHQIPHFDPADPKKVTFRDFEKDDFPILKAYFEEIAAQLRSGKELVLPVTNSQFPEILRDLVWSGLKDEIEGLKKSDVGKMLTPKSLNAGALDTILAAIREGTVPGPNE